MATEKPRGSEDRHDISDDAFRASAKDQYEREGEIEIDEVAVVSRGSDDGAYVAAWVWVSNAAAAKASR